MREFCGFGGRSLGVAALMTFSASIHHGRLAHTRPCSEQRVKVLSDAAITCHGMATLDRTKRAVIKRVFQYLSRAFSPSCSVGFWH